jgi:hypothetical protein
MVETFFGFKKSPFGDSPDAKQLFCFAVLNAGEGAARMPKADATELVPKKSAYRNPAHFIPAGGFLVSAPVPLRGP